MHGLALSQRSLMKYLSAMPLLCSFHLMFKCCTLSVTARRRTQPLEAAVFRQTAEDRRSSTSIAHSCEALGWELTWKDQRRADRVRSRIMCAFELLSLYLSSWSVLGMPDTVDEMCPDLPQLEALMKEINDLAESGARYTEMPHIIEVILPMLCNYLSYWWERGPEHLPPSTGPWCTKVTSEHLSVILGNILKIINNNLGIDEASWMKRIAGTVDPFLPWPWLSDQEAQILFSPLSLSLHYFPLHSLVT